MGKKTNLVRVAGAFLLFLGLVIGAAGCGGSSATTTPDAVTEDPATASENNASRALDTTGLSVTTTIPSNQ